MLFLSFPRRPQDAVIYLCQSLPTSGGAERRNHMFDLRSATERVCRRLSLPEFLSRLAVPVQVRGCMLQNLLRSNVSTAEEFVRYVTANTNVGSKKKPGQQGSKRQNHPQLPPGGGGGGDDYDDDVGSHATAAPVTRTQSDPKMIAKLCGQHCISAALAQRIIDVCSKIPAACEKFAPVSSSRAFKVFQGFYAASSSCNMQPVEIENIAYEFSRSLADARGICCVSLFQLYSFLQDYDNDPKQALEVLTSVGVKHIPMFAAQHELLPAPSIHAIMLRLGLERHAELFQRIGFTSLESLQKCENWNAVAEVNEIVHHCSANRMLMRGADVSRVCA